MRRRRSRFSAVVWARARTCDRCARVPYEDRCRSRFLNSTAAEGVQFRASVKQSSGRPMGKTRLGQHLRRAASWLVLAAAFVVGGGAGTVMGEQISATPTPAPASPLALANNILNRWEPIAADAGAHWIGWREMFATQLGAMDVSTLRSLDRLKIETSDSAAVAYARFAQAVRGAEMQTYQHAVAGKVRAKLGSPADDQVFVPIVPCRIVDTRNVGGPIAAGTTRNFRFYSIGSSDDWSTQGGIAGPSTVTCPGTVLPAGGVYGPSAAVITVTVVSPTAAGNWIIWGGANPIPTVSALNWTGPGQILANTTAVPFGGRNGTGPGGGILDFAVSYNGPSGSAQFVADVVGYFVITQATALDCFETAVASAPASTLSAPSFVTSPSCPAGYSVVGGNCDTDNRFGSILEGAYRQASVSAWTCEYDSEGPNIYATSICCRAPGL